jgi:hypothetical protein
MHEKWLVGTGRNSQEAPEYATFAREPPEAFALSLGFVGSQRRPLTASKLLTESGANTSAMGPNSHGDGSLQCGTTGIWDQHLSIHSLATDGHCEQQSARI